MALFDPKQLAQRVCAQWGHFQVLSAHSPPPVDHLTRILEAAYLASMETEEGRPLKFGLILRASGEEDESEYAIARFGERRPLSTSEIRRLAPATGLSSTFIAVESSDKEPVIWGTVDVGSQWASFQTAEQTSGIGLPFSLVITVTAPGTISLKFGDSLLYSVEHGQPAQPTSNVLKLGPIHEFFQPVISRLLEEAFPNRPQLIAERFFFFSYGGEYLRFLARTLRYAEELGHGGAIIVLREEDETRIGEHVSIKYSTENCHLWPELVQYVRLICEEIESSKLVSGESGIQRERFDCWRDAARQKEKLSRRLIDRSRFLARLTQVDGALLLTERLKVIGFGCIINELSEMQPTVRSCQDESCRTFTDLRRQSFGTRHRSAIGLCERIDCTAFVLSQDGGVKALRRADEEVLVWPSLMLGPAAWFVTAEDLNPQ